MSSRCVFFIVLSLCGLRMGTSAQGRHVQVVEAVTGGNYVLQCTAEAEPGVNYTSLRWYKFGAPLELAHPGLEVQQLPNNVMSKYVLLEREVELLDCAIFLPNVTCNDAGEYMCRLQAPMGEQDRMGEVLLTMSDCSDANMGQLWTDVHIIIFASAALLLALFIFLVAYGSSKTILQDRKKTPNPKISLDAPLKPLDKKDLMLISTLGQPYSPKKSTMKHILYV
uniref:CD83 antigen n=1 Tax=Doryrhamphus excisus TaxID=161450 RepID=UPI0025AE8662|nr:CD83 antigen [Doryrhamphus excisus]